MITVKQLILSLHNLPLDWTLQLDNVGHVCIVNQAGQIVGYFDVATGEIDRWDDSV